MLVGTGGTGKSSVVKFASFISQCSMKTIDVKADFKLSEFREELKAMFREVGINDKYITFAFSDSQITNETFLEDINNILNSGEVIKTFEC